MLVPNTAYTSSGTNAITTIALCNIGAPDITDESVNTVNVSVYLCPQSAGFTGTNQLLVANLTVPAGETVFFSDEKFVLDNGDTIRIGTSTNNLIVATISTLTV